MKSIAAITCVAVATLAGCATTEPNTAMNEATCKLGPTTFTSITGVGKPKPVNKLDQAYAQMQLATSNYRWNQLAIRGPVNNLNEDVLRGCNLADMNEAS